MSGFDLFLSYHGADRQLVQELQTLLKARGLTTFLDRDNLVPGLPWLPALEQALGECRAVAVLIGPNGMGEWQKKEKDLSLERQVRERSQGRDFPVIPILLPDVRDPGGGFLFQNTWVDLRHGVRDEEAIEMLLRALSGGTPAAQPEIRISPYRGLRFFREEDAAFFCGREAAARELLELVLHQDLVTLVGSSGSGKSSLAQAGLLPLLRRQRPPAAVWDAICFSPGARPFRALAGAFGPLLDGERDKDACEDLAVRRAARFTAAPEEVEETFRRCFVEWQGTDRILVIVDQLEELFTQSQEKDRRPFLAALLEAQKRLPLTLLFTLRADFYGLATGFDPALGKKILLGQMNLGAMTRDDLRQAIARPAALAGLTFEPGLADRILDDAGEEPGTLPLVEFALNALWERGRRERVLTHHDYEEIGKVAGAIAATADGFVAALPPEEQPAVRRIFTRLVRVSPPEEGSRRSRQRIPLDALSPLEQEVARTLATEKGRRLLVLGRDGMAETVTLAHEALIQHWQRLQEWLGDDQKLLLWRQRLQSSLEQWEAAGREDEALLHGALLSEAERWLKARPDDLSPEERRFIEKSTERDRANRRRKRSMVVGLVILGIILVGAAFLIVKEQAATVRQSQKTTARRLSLQIPGILANHQQTALLLAIEAFQRTRDAREPRFPPVEQTLRQTLSVFGGRVLGSYRGHYRQIVASPDRTFVAGFADDGKIRAWNLNAADPTKTEQTFGGLEGKLGRFEISPANRWLLMVTADKKRLVLQRLKERTDLQEIPLRSPLALVGFSPDDRWLALRSANEGTRLFDLEAPGAPERPLPPLDTIATVMAFSPDGRWLAVGDGKGIVHLLPLKGGPEGPWASPAGNIVTALCFVPGADQLVAADTAGKLKLWAWRDKSTAVGWHELDTAQSRGAPALQVSADGRWLIVWRGRAKVVEIWDLAAAKQVRRFGDVTALTVRGGLLALVARGRIVRTVLSENGEVQDLGAFAGPVLEMSPTGRWLIAGVGNTRFAALWTVPPSEKGLPADLPVALGGHDVDVDILGIGADERWALTSGSTGAPPRVWELGANPAAPTEPEPSSRNTAPANVPTPSMLARVHDQEPTIDQAVASVDGRWLVVSLPPSTDGNVQVHLWDLRPSKPVLLPLRSHREGVGTLVFSPDGRLLATGGKDRVIRLFRLDSSISEPVVLEPGGGEITAAAFARDSGWLAVAAGDQIVRLWRNPGSLDRNAPPDRQVDGHAEPLTSLAFGPGSWVAAGGKEGTVYLWDQKLYPHTPVAVKKHDRVVRTLSFSEDGRWLVSADEVGFTLRSRMREDDLERFACQTVGRNLRRQEWADSLPGEDYRRTCPEFPPG
jgi:WD40 repeat protein